jgi:hypothetical protein
MMVAIAVALGAFTWQALASVSKTDAKPYRVTVGTSRTTGTAVPTRSQAICWSVKRCSRARVRIATRRKGSKSGHERWI